MLGFLGLRQSKDLKRVKSGARIVLNHAQPQENVVVCCWVISYILWLVIGCLRFNTAGNKPLLINYRGHPQKSQKNDECP